jgi:hypothetical protein
VSYCTWNLRCFFFLLLSCFSSVFPQYFPILFSPLFLLDIFFVYISNFIPFPHFLSEPPPPRIPFPLPLPTNPPHSIFPILVFPYTGALDLHKTKVSLEYPVLSHYLLEVYNLLFGCRGYD